MSREMLNLRSAAEHVHMDANELRHVAQRGEIDFSEHGGDLWFEHRALDEWAQRNLLASGHREQIRQHNVILEEQRRSNSADWRVWRLFAPTGIVLGVPGKAKAGILRDMTSIADATGFVYDPDALFKELVAREETASTAVGEGAAFLHPRFHDPYMFQETFVAYGRSERPVFFGHYWLTGLPKLIRGNVCCLDFSVAGYRGDGRLAAYRFDGEQTLDESKFVWVEAI